MHHCKMTHWFLKICLISFRLAEMFNISKEVMLVIRVTLIDEFECRMPLDSSHVFRVFRSHKLSFDSFDE